MLRLGAVLLLTTSLAFAHDHDDAGTAIHRGDATVYHDGDYADFNLNFRAWHCDDQVGTRNKVIENVRAFETWLNSERVSYENAVLDYHINLINVWQERSDYPIVYPIASPAFPKNEYCDHNYIADQNVRVRLNKLQADASLDSGLIQRFFNDLQTVIAPFNVISDLTSSTKISSVQKGLHEHTVNELRIAAKHKARVNATQDFLAFLGTEYKGWWHLHSVDFSQGSFAGLRAYEIGGQIGNVGHAAELSALNLEPISFEVTGNFLYHFQTWDNFLPKD